MASFNARRSLSTLLSRALSSPLSSSSLSSRSRLAFALLGNSPVSIPEVVKIMTRTKTSGSGYSPLNDPSPNWSNRPPKETILLDGCDYEHWLIVLEFPEDPKLSEEEMIDAYVKTLASVDYLVCSGFCRIRISMFRTKIMEGICLLMGKSSIGHNIQVRFSHLAPEFEDVVKDMLEDDVFCYYGEEPPITADVFGLPFHRILVEVKIKAEAYHPTDTTTAAAPPISFPKSFGKSWTSSGPSGGNCSGIDIVNKSPNLFGDLVSSAL
ncbi:hypothetical protein V6N13_013716 [Hibiscus sabdariffa]